MGGIISPGNTQPEPEQYLGAFGDAANTIRPIRLAQEIQNTGNSNRDQGSYHLEADGDERGTDIIDFDELRRRHAASRQREEDEDIPLSESSDEDDRNNSKRGMLHRELDRGEAADNADTARGLMYVDGEAVPYSQLSLRQRTGPPPSDLAETVRWYLSVDVGSSAAFEANFDQAGTTMIVPLHAMGRYIKVVYTQRKADYQELGYESTVGNAYEPVGDILRRPEQNVRVAQAITVGPVTLPDEWFLSYAQMLLSPPVSATLAAQDVKTAAPVVLTINNDSLNLARTSATDSIPLDAIWFRLKAGTERSLLQLCSTHQPSAITEVFAEDETALIHFWGFAQCIQLRPSSDAELNDRLPALFQKWLVQQRKHDLVVT